MTKVKVKKFFWYLTKKLVPHMLSHRENVRTSKLWQKFKEKKQIFFTNVDQDRIILWFRPTKNSKLSHACVPLWASRTVYKSMSSLLTWRNFLLISKPNTFAGYSQQFLVLPSSLWPEHWTTFFEYAL